MKVKVLTVGEYSDTRVIGVFSDDEKLNRAIKLYGSFNQPIEFELDEIKLDVEGCVPYAVEMDKKGKVIECEQTIVNYIDPENESLGWSPAENGSIDFYMWAKDKKHAIKIANERRTILIANNQWIENFDEFWKKQNTLIRFIR